MGEVVGGQLRLCPLLAFCSLISATGSLSEHPGSSWKGLPASLPGAPHGPSVLGPWLSQCGLPPPPSLPDPVSPVLQVSKCFASKCLQEILHHSHMST